MSSPLSWFRKNQKLLLGFFGVALMFVFTISLGSGVDPIIDRLSGRSGGGPSNDDVVTWDGGQLGENQLNRLRTQRILLRRFVSGVIQTARERGGQQQVSMLPLSSDEQSLLELELLAREADLMGVVVNDETVLGYLNQLSGGTIQPAEYGQLLKEYTGNNLSENSLFALLAREIKAQKVRGLVQSGSYPASPVAGWDYYNRLNRLIKAEIMPLMVDDYLDQVGQPSDAEVAALFEKYKHQYSHPLSPEPGFRQRERRAFQYVKISYDAILEDEKAAVTDEEIQKYYNENKEQYLKTTEDDLNFDVDLEQPETTESSSSPPDDPPADEGDDAAETSSVETTPEDVEDSPLDESDAANSESTPDAPTESTEDPSESGETGGETAQPAEIDTDNSDVESAVPPIQPPAPAPTALPQAEDAGEQPETTVPQPPNDPLPDAPTDAESADGDPVNTDADAETKDPDTEEAKSEDPKSEDASSPATTSTFDGETTTGQPAAADSTVDATAVESTDTASSDTTKVDETKETPADEEFDVSDLEGISTYRALSEVADEIRQSIAAPRAQTRMRDLLEVVRREMDVYFKDYTLFEMDFVELVQKQLTFSGKKSVAEEAGITEAKLDRILNSDQKVSLETAKRIATAVGIDIETNPDLQKPLLPDFSSIVGGEYATVGTIELTDRIDIENYDIGQALDFIITPQSGVQRVLFANVAYDPSSQLYQPLVFPNLEMAPERYVFWMTDREEEYEPTLDQVRDKVVEAWQRQQALEIAKVDAERLVAKAKAAKTKLEECLADEEHTAFVDTGEVSWVTLPLQEGAAPRIAPIAGAEDAGDELRKKLFRLPPGGVGYAPNLPKTKVYVFRVAEETPGPEIRREQFLRFGTQGPVQSLASQDSYNSLSRWYRELNERYNVDWRRNPRRGDDGGF